MAKRRRDTDFDKKNLPKPPPAEPAAEEAVEFAMGPDTSSSGDPPSKAIAKTVLSTDFANIPNMSLDEPEALEAEVVELEEISAEPVLEPSSAVLSAEVVEAAPDSAELSPVEATLLPDEETPGSDVLSAELLPEGEAASASHPSSDVFAAEFLEPQTSGSSLVVDALPEPLLAGEAIDSAVLMHPDSGDSGSGPMEAQPISDVFTGEFAQNDTAGSASKKPSSNVFSGAVLQEGSAVQAAELIEDGDISEDVVSAVMLSQDEPASAIVAAEEPSVEAALADEEVIAAEPASAVAQAEEASLLDDVALNSGDAPSAMAAAEEPSVEAALVDDELIAAEPASAVAKVDDLEEEPIAVIAEEEPSVEAALVDDDLLAAEPASVSEVDDLEEEPVAAIAEEEPSVEAALVDDDLLAAEPASVSEVDDLEEEPIAVIAEEEPSVEAALVDDDLLAAEPASVSEVDDLEEEPVAAIAEEEPSVEAALVDDDLLAAEPASVSEVDDLEEEPVAAIAEEEPSVEAALVDDGELIAAEPASAVAKVEDLEEEPIAAIAEEEPSVEAALVDDDLLAAEPASVSEVDDLEEEPIAAIADEEPTVEAALVDDDLLVAEPASISEADDLEEESVAAIADEEPSVEAALVEDDESVAAEPVSVSEVDDLEEESVAAIADEEPSVEAALVDDDELIAAEPASGVAKVEDLDEEPIAAIADEDPSVEAAMADDELIAVEPASDVAAVEEPDKMPIAAAPEDEPSTEAALEGEADTGGADAALFPEEVAAEEPEAAIVADTGSSVFPAEAGLDVALFPDDSLVTEQKAASPPAAAGLDAALFPDDLFALAQPPSAVVPSEMAAEASDAGAAQEPSSVVLGDEAPMIGEPASAAVAAHDEDNAEEADEKVIAIEPASAAILADNFTESALDDSAPFQVEPASAVAAAASSDLSEPVSSVEATETEAALDDEELVSAEPASAIAAVADETEAALVDEDLVSAEPASAIAAIEDEDDGEGEAALGGEEPVSAEPASAIAALEEDEAEGALDDEELVSAEPASAIAEAAEEAEVLEDDEPIAAQPASAIQALSYDDIFKVQSDSDVARAEETGSAVLAAEAADDEEIAAAEPASAIEALEDEDLIAAEAASDVAEAGSAVSGAEAVAGIEWDDEELQAEESHLATDATIGLDLTEVGEGVAEPAAEETEVMDVLDFVDREEPIAAEDADEEIAVAAEEEEEVAEAAEEAEEADEEIAVAAEEEEEVAEAAEEAEEADEEIAVAAEEEEVAEAAEETEEADEEIAVAAEEEEIAEAAEEAEEAEEEIAVAAEDDESAEATEADEEIATAADDDEPVEGEAEVAEAEEDIIAEAEAEEEVAEAEEDIIAEAEAEEEIAEAEEDIIAEAEAEEEIAEAEEDIIAEAEEEITEADDDILAESEAEEEIAEAEEEIVAEAEFEVAAETLKPGKRGKPTMQASEPWSRRGKPTQAISEEEILEAEEEILEAEPEVEILLAEDEILEAEPEEKEVFVAEDDVAAEDWPAPKTRAKPEDWPAPKTPAKRAPAKPFELVVDEDAIITAAEDDGDIVVSEALDDDRGELVVSEALDDGDLLVTEPLDDDDGMLVTEELYGDDDIMVTEPLGADGEMLVTEELYDDDLLVTEPIYGGDKNGGAVVSEPLYHKEFHGDEDVVVVETLGAEVDDYVAPSRAGKGRYADEEGEPVHERQKKPWMSLRWIGGMFLGWFLAAGTAVGIWYFSPELIEQVKNELPESPNAAAKEVKRELLPDEYAIAKAPLDSLRDSVARGNSADDKADAKTSEEILAAAAAMIKAKQDQDEQLKKLGDGRLMDDKKNIVAQLDDWLKELTRTQENLQATLKQVNGALKIDEAADTVALARKLYDARKDLDDKLADVNKFLGGANIKGQGPLGVKELVDARNALEADRDDLDAVVKGALKELADARAVKAGADMRKDVMDGIKTIRAKSENPIGLSLSYLVSSMSGVGPGLAGYFDKALENTGLLARLKFYEAREEFLITPAEKMEVYLTLLKDRRNKDPRDLRTAQHQAQWLLEPQAESSALVKAKAHYLLALVFRNEQKFDESRKALQAGMDEADLAKKEDVKLGRLLGMELRDSLKEMTDPMVYFMPRIERLQELGRLPAALDELNLAVQAIPGDARLLARRSLVRLEVLRSDSKFVPGKVPQNVQDLIRADAAMADKDPGAKVEATFVMGLLEEEIGNLKNAEDLYREALKLHKGSAEEAGKIRIALGRVLQRERTPAGLAVPQSRLGEPDRKRGEELVCDDMDETDVATESEEAPIAANFHPISALVAAAIIAQPQFDDDEDPALAKRINESIEIAKELIASDNPKIKGQGYIMMGLALAKKGRRTEGLRVYVDGLKLVNPGKETKDLVKMIEEHPIFQQPDVATRPNKGLADYHFAQGRQLYFAKKYPEAEAHFKQAVSYFDQSAVYMYFFGLSQLAQNTRAKRDAADYSLTRAGKLEARGYPSWAEVNVSLERIQGELRQHLNRYRMGGINAVE